MPFLQIAVFLLLFFGGFFVVFFVIVVLYSSSLLRKTLHRDCSFSLVPSFIVLLDNMPLYNSYFLDWLQSPVTQYFPHNPV